MGEHVQQQKRTTQKGFTLIEVAIVTLIGGILLATASTLLTTYTKKVQINTTEKRLEAIDDAIQLFLSLNGRYPCVADPTEPLDGANFGREAVNCPSATLAAGGRNNDPVRIGAVPVRTLNLPDEFIADAWGGRFTYAVTESLTDTGTYNRDFGAVYVLDNTYPGDKNDLNDSYITPQGSGHYAIVSHGANNSGATPVGGGAAQACPPNNLEEANCDGDAVFRSTLITGTADNVSLYDDMLLVRAIPQFGNDTIPDGAVMAFNLPACPDGWVSFSSADGRTVIGVGGSYTFRETGGLEEVELTTMQAGFTVAADEIQPAALGPATAGSSSYLVDVTPSDHENMPPYIALTYCEKT